MQTINLQVNGKPIVFTGQSLTFAGREFLYSKMSDIAHRGGENPAFVFTYEGKRLAMPYDPKDKDIIMRIFQQVIAMNKKRAEEAAKEEPVEEPITPDPKGMADFSMFSDYEQFQPSTPQQQSYSRPVIEQPTPPPQYTTRERQMACPRCGSSNIIVHNTEKQHFKQGHGCLGLIFFGIYYVFWLVIKWTCKIVVVGLYWLCVGWWYAAYCKMKGKNRTTPQFIVNLTRKRGKMYNDTITHGVCQSCGHTWTI